MIRHTVLFKIVPTISNQKIQEIFSEIHALKHKLSGIGSIACGECRFNEGKSLRLKQLFSHGFSIDFKDQASLDEFFNDPITYPVKDMIVAVAEGGYDGIMGFDLSTRS